MTESKENICMHEKLTRIQNELLRIPMAKSGKNSFGGFNYYELDDLLPPITLLCEQYECTMFFNFPINEEGVCKKGELHLINWRDTSDRIVIELPFPELEKLPKMNNAQVTGTYQTYLKRYLLLNAFNIVEDEVLDATNPTDFEEGKNSSKKKSLNIKKEKKPSCLQKVIQKCNEEYSDEECDYRLLNKVSMKMYKSNELTASERKEVVEYLNKQKK